MFETLSADSVVSSGEMHGLVRSLDWSRTALGPMDGWPPCLQSTVDMLLAHPFPMVLLWGPQLTQIYNDGYRRIAGGKHPVALGQPTRECWPEAWHLTAPLYEKVLATGESVSLEDRRIPLVRNGCLEDCYFTLAYSPVRDGQKTAAGILVTIFETTDEQATQRALRQGAEQLSLALAAAKLGDWAWDANTDLLTMSVEAAKIFAVPPGTHSTRTRMRDMIHPEHRDLARLAAEGAAAMHSDYDIEYRVNRGDGKQVWVAAKGRGQYDAAGNITGMLGVIQDITERKAAEAERERLLAGERAARADAERRAAELDAVIDNMHDAVYIGDEHGIHKCNRKAMEMLGFPDPNSLRRAIRQLAETIETRFADTGERIGPGDEPFERALAGEATVREVIARNIKTGDDVIVRCAAAPIERDGKVVGAVAVNTDVTAHRRAERERERLLESERAARADAERASHMKDEFLATLSHELRTPLNAILGWSQILSSGPRDEEDLAQGLKTIERNARAQTQIIEDLLDMSRIISGKVRLDVRRVEVLPVVEAAIETMRPAADAKGIRLTPVLDPDAGPISGDPGRLQQIFWNLLSNAIKFTPRGGQVQVVLRRVESHIEVAFTDTGQGIKPEFLPHVFERFRQADASTTRAHGGLGLGLAIVKQLVELHGGTVHAASAGLAQGSTFVVALPISALDAPYDARDVNPHPAEETAARTARPMPSLRGLRVLVVDDEPDARALVSRLLEDSGAQVTTASSAAEALAAVANRPPDVLVSDIGMPTEDGFALIRRLRDLPAEAGGNTPAIALTAYARSEDRQHVIYAGFQMHVCKPVEPTELITMVASLAGRTDGRAVTPV
jgi:signal transduction histidine kinase/ActR/RegA family two-component response regulator